MFLRTALFACLVFCLAAPMTFGQNHTVGVISYDRQNTFDGYTLYSPFSDTNTYLVDMYGRLVHHWNHEYTPGHVTYLLENGNLLRAANIGYSGGGGGKVQEFDWDGNLIWDFQYASGEVLQHHDLEYLPNGNILIMAWEWKYLVESVLAGRNPALFDQDSIMPEHIIEVRPIYPDSGEIVWEWHMWDHLIQDYDITKANYGVVEDHPELLDINYNDNGAPDFVHANSIDYNPELDQIILSVRQWDEFWVIDHSTTSAEAASHAGGIYGKGGDILYRWGNPATYRHGTLDDRQLFKQHDVHWIPPGLPGEGHFLIFNNGTDRFYSSVDEVVSPVGGSGFYPTITVGETYPPDTATWAYVADPPNDFMELFISGSQRLPNGNTLVCGGPTGEFFELTNDKQKVWEYTAPVGQGGPVQQGQVPSQPYEFRCYRYAAGYPGFAGHDLTPLGTVEGYAITIQTAQATPADPTDQDVITISAKVFSDPGVTSVETLIDTGDGYFSLDLFDDGAHGDGAAGDSVYAADIGPLHGGTSATFYISATDVTDTTVVDPSLAPVIAYDLTVTATYVCGDANGSGEVDIDDAVFLIAYIFSGGPEPNPVQSGDADCTGYIDIDDVVYIITYIFSGGPNPCDPDGNGIPNC